MSTRFADTSLDFVRPASAAQRTDGRKTTGFSFIRWVLDMPRRQAVINELDALSDHELADIGLSRGDVPRVFDAEFTASRLAG